MKKSWFVISLLVILALLAACVQQPATAPATPAGGAAQPTAASSGDGQAAGGCTLRIIGGARSYEGEEAVWNQFFSEFEQQYGCQVEARWQGEWSDTPQMLETARMAQEPVDIVYNSATLTYTMARSGVLMDLTEIVKPIEGRFAEGMLEKYTLGDKVWAVPLSDSSTSTFFYNADLFAELGLSEPKTYADLQAIAKTIREQKPDVLPLIHQGKEPWYWPMWFFETFAQTSGNRSIQYTQDFLSGKRPFGAEEQKAIEDIARFYQDGIMTQESLDTDNEGMRAAFVQGKAAMFYGGTWEVAPLRSANPPFEVGIFQFPQMEAGATPQHGGGPDNAWSIPSFIAPENLPMAAQFLEFITRPENAQKLLDTYVAMIPSIQGVTPADDPFAAELNAEYVPNTITYLDWIWPNKINDVIMEVIPAVMTENMSSEEAVQRVQDAYDTLVEEEEYSYDWWNTWTEQDWQKVTPAQVPQYEVK